MAKKSKVAKGLGKGMRFVAFSTKGLLRLIFVDSFRVTKEAYNHAKYPEKKLMLDRKLEVEKQVDLHKERLERVERLVYSMFQDPSYSKTDKGKSDLKDLGDKVQ